jgi:hypothetical protein
MSLLAELEQAGALTKTSLTLPPGVSYERYEALFSMLMHTRDSMCWLLGDLINYGEAAYGETYAQAVEVTGLAVQTLTNYAAVCRRIPRSRRRPPSRLSFSVHAEVAFMEPKEQERWLKEAEKNSWPRWRLREELAPSRAESKPSTKRSEGAAAPALTNGKGNEILPPAVEVVCECPACGRRHRTDVDVEE